MSEDLHTHESRMWLNWTGTVRLGTGTLIPHGKGGGRIWTLSGTVLKGFLQFILVLQATSLVSAGVGIMNSVSEILFVKYKQVIFGTAEGK